MEKLDQSSLACQASAATGLSVVLLEWRPYTTMYELCLGLQYVAAMLRQDGHTVHIHIFESILIEDACKAILSQQPDIVGIQLFRDTADQAFEIAQRLKSARPEIVTVMGGHTATLHAAQILNGHPEIDIIVAGEGELTMVDLCNRIYRQENLAGCKGISYRHRGFIHRNPPRELIHDMDALPMPAPDVLLAQTKKTNPCVVANIQTSRGCMATCAFCVENRVYEGDRKLHWRGKSPEVIVNEIKQLRQLFPDKRLVIRFIDSSFEDPDGKTKVRFRQIIDLIEENQIDIAFAFFTRAENWTEEDIPLIQRLRRLGLFRVYIGFETGSRISLKNVFRKRANVEDNLRTAALFSQNDIYVFGFSIMFQPFTMLDELRVNAEFLKHVKMAYHPEMWSHDLIIHSDTRIFRHTVSNGLILGPDAGGYVFDYAFEDGRVGKIHKIMQRIAASRPAIDFAETAAKLETELLLYGVWKDRLQEMGKIEDEMRSHKNEVFLTYDELGSQQYALFLKLVDAAEKEHLEMVQDQIIEEWTTLLAQKREHLESSWLRCSISLRRKGVRLL